MLGVALHLDPDGAVGIRVLDWLHALALRDREERSLHHLGMVFRRIVDDIRREEVADGMRINARGRWRIPRERHA